MKALIQLAKDHGINARGATLITDRVNRIFELDGSEIIARIRKPISGETVDFGRSVLELERSAATALSEVGALTIQPLRDVEILPIENTWVSFWHKEQFAAIKISGTELAHSVKALESGLSLTDLSLRPLSTWEHAARSARLAHASADARVQNIAVAYDAFDTTLRDIPLFPAHGDAHAGNLLSTDRGWVWLDFEDVSLMPRYWDIATAVARSVVFGWERDVSVEALSSYGEIDWNEFLLSLTARSVQNALLCWEFRGELNENDLVEARIEATDHILKDPNSVRECLRVCSR